MNKSYFIVPAVALALASFLLIHLAAADTTAGHAAPSATATAAASADQTTPDIQALTSTRQAR